LQALASKANASDLASKANQIDLDNFITDHNLATLQDVATKQNILTAGDGISITNDGIISSTIDTNMWLIVDQLP